MDDLGCPVEAGENALDLRGEVLGTVSGTASPSRDRGEAVAVDQVQELERRPGGRFSPRSHWLMSPLVTFR
jgi:hypothetical protein